MGRKNNIRSKKKGEDFNNQNQEIDISCDDIDMINGDMYIINIKYWKLEKYSCVLIKRNREWFNNNLEKIINFWKDVEKYREKGIQTIPYYQAPLPKKFNTYAFIED